MTRSSHALRLLATVVALAAVAIPASASLVEEAGSPFAVGTEPYWATAADFNADGRPDLAVANDSSASPSGTVSVLLRQPFGGFALEGGAAVAVGARPDSVAAADFNADGRQDLAVSNFVSSTVTVLLRRADNTGFDEEAGSPVAVGTSPHAVVTGDFNGDGRTDLATSSYALSTVTVLLRDEDNTGFAQEPGSPYGVGTNPTGLALADFDGDGRLDIAAAGQGSANVTVLLRDPDNAGFGAEAGIAPATGAGPVGITTADFNADGRPDLAVANEDSGTVTVLLRQAGGGFGQAPGSPHAIGTGAYGLANADLNLDGRPDLVATAFEANSLAVLNGSATGDFTPATFAPLPTAYHPLVPAAADFDGDGRPDVAIPNNGAHTVTVRLNRSDADAPAVPAAPATCPVPTAGRLALWRGEGSARDSAGAHDGTLEHGGSYRAGVVGQAFSLPGTDDYVHVPDRPDLDVTGDLTLDAWVQIDDRNFGASNPYGVGGDRVIFWNVDAADEKLTYALWIEGDFPVSADAAQLKFAAGERGTADYHVGSDPVAWQQDTWYHLTVTRSGNTVTFFRDGQAIGAATIGQAAVVTDDAPVTLGAALTGTTVTNPIDGAIDEVEIWDRALTSDEVRAIYQTGTATCPAPPPEPEPEPEPVPPAPPAPLPAGGVDFTWSPKADVQIAGAPAGGLQFDATAGDGVTYEWDFDYDPAAGFRPDPAATGRTPRHAFAASPEAKYEAGAGQQEVTRREGRRPYRVRLRATAANGQISEVEHELVVMPNNAPLVDLVVDTDTDAETGVTGNVAKPVHLRPKVSDPDAGPGLGDRIVRIEWDLDSDAAEGGTDLTCDGDGANCRSFERCPDPQGCVPAPWYSPGPEGEANVNFFERALFGAVSTPLRLRPGIDTNIDPRPYSLYYDILKGHNTTKESKGHDSRVVLLYEFASMLAQSSFNLDAGEATGAVRLGAAAAQRKLKAVGGGNRVKPNPLTASKALLYRSVKLTAYDSTGASASVVRSVPLHPNRAPTIKALFVKKGKQNTVLEPNRPPFPPGRARAAQDVSNERVDYPLTTASELRFDPSTTFDPDSKIAYYTLEVGRPVGPPCSGAPGEQAAPRPEDELNFERVVDPPFNVAGAGPAGAIGPVGNVGGRAGRAQAAQATKPESFAAMAARPSYIHHVCEEFGYRNVNPIEIARPNTINPVAGGPEPRHRAIFTRDPQGLVFRIPQEGLWSVAIGAYDEQGVGAIQRTDGFLIGPAAGKCRDMRGQPFKLTGKITFGFSGSCVDFGGESTQYWTHESLSFNGVELRPHAENSADHPALVVCEDEQDASQRRLFATNAKQPASWTAPKTKIPCKDVEQAAAPPVDVVLDGDVVGRFESFTWDVARKYFRNEPGSAPPLPKVEGDVPRFHGSPIASPRIETAFDDGTTGRSDIHFDVWLPKQFGATEDPESAPVDRAGREEPRSSQLTTKRFAEIARRKRRRKARAAQASSSVIHLTSQQIGPVKISAGDLKYDPKEGVFAGELNFNLLDLPGVNKGKIRIVIQDGELKEARGEVETTIPIAGPTVTLDEVRFGVVSDPFSLSGGAQFSAAKLIAADLNLTIDIPARTVSRVLAEGEFKIVGIPLANAFVDWRVGAKYLEFGGEFSKGFGPVSIEAGLKGGFSYDQFDFYLHGDAEVCLELCIGGELLVGTRALAGCGKVKIYNPVGDDFVIAGGAAVIFVPTQIKTFFGCDIEEYKPQWTTARAAIASGPQPIAVAAGHELASFRFTGAGDPPKLTLRSPDGRTFVTPGVPGDFRFFQPTQLDGSAGARAQSSFSGAFVDQDPLGNVTTIIVANPAAGKWTIEPAPGTPAPTAAELAYGEHLVDADFKSTVVAASVSGTSSTVKIGKRRYRSGKSKQRKPRIKRTQVADLEALPAIEAKRLRGLVLDVPKGLDGTLAVIDDGPAGTAVLDKLDLARTSGTSVPIAFAPAPDPGEHVVSAFITHPNGLPRGSYEIARYTAPQIPRPTAPGLRLTRDRRGRTSLLVRPGSAGPLTDGTADLLVTVRTSGGQRTSRTVESSDVKRLPGGRFRLGLGRIPRRESVKVTGQMIYAGRAGATARVGLRASRVRKTRKGRVR